MDVSMLCFVTAFFFEASDIQIFNTDVIIAIDIGSR